ncbi:hypothetical protein PPACK8108_LOCUS666 [Phakopsora pachyrhizi]|uniref:Uncharacterized protein n=1 Tax=Phakopsora pachyrhizi TaxID=170000 RepID=A0AAV0AE23_PHAPC|nr:hypothetical protein PPACK8108_LOCUS666 [Phakopsora pachyrhizi]
MVNGGWLVLRHLNIDRAKVELIKVKAEQEVKLRWIPGFQSGLESTEAIGDEQSDTLRMIPQTRTISQLYDDKDEEEDYNEMIQEEDEEQRGMEGPLPMALIPEHQSRRGPTKTEGWDAR